MDIETLEVTLTKAQRENTGVQALNFNGIRLKVEVKEKRKKNNLKDLESEVLILCALVR